MAGNLITLADSAPPSNPAVVSTRGTKRSGYRHLPGQFSVTQETGYTWQATHLHNTLRATRPLDDYDPSVKKPQLWIFGCSFTHGWSMNDNETYPWIVQESLSELDVVNYGVGGYGNVQSLLQLREALATSGQKPVAVVLSYGSMHDERNSYVRRFQKAIARSEEVAHLGWKREVVPWPFARVKDGNLVIKHEPIEYTEAPLMRHSAFVTLLEDFYNRVEAKLVDSQEISQAVLVEFDSLCKKHSVPFVLAGIESDAKTREVLSNCKEQGLSTRGYLRKSRTAGNAESASRPSPESEGSAAVCREVVGLPARRPEA